jgi:hypothetical protein
MTTCHKIIGGTTGTILVSFSGQGMGLGTLPQFEFVNFLNKHFPNDEKHFYIDKHLKWYHCGIEGISVNIPETVDYLKKQIEGFTKVVFMGSSAGGTAAILFGSLLNVNTVIAFRPQTILPQHRITVEEYGNLRSFINDTTSYFIYGDLSVDKQTDPFHHIYHCENIDIKPNVVVYKEKNVDLREMRDDGRLLAIVKKHIHNQQKPTVSAPSL